MMVEKVVGMNLVVAAAGPIGSLQIVFSGYIGESRAQVR